MLKPSYFPNFFMLVWKLWTNYIKMSFSVRLLINKNGGKKRTILREKCAIPYKTCNCQCNCGCDSQSTDNFIKLTMCELYVILCVSRITSRIVYFIWFFPNCFHWIQWQKYFKNKVFWKGLNLQPLVSETRMLPQHQQERQNLQTDSNSCFSDLSDSLNSLNFCSI